MNGKDLPTREKDVIYALFAVVKSFAKVGTYRLASPPIPGPTGPDGRHATGSGIYAHIHIKPIQWVHEVVLDPHLTWVAPSSLYRTGADPGSEHRLRLYTNAR